MKPARDSHGRLLPGASLNPTGRPKIAGELQEILSAASPDAARRVVAMMDSPDPKIALAACTAILDRVLGKPKQAVDLDVTSVNATLGAILAARQPPPETP